MTRRRAFLGPFITYFSNFLILFPVLIGPTCVFNYTSLGTISSKPKKSEIRALQTQLRDKPLNLVAAPKANGSLEDLGVKPDEGID